MSTMNFIKNILILCSFAVLCFSCGKAGGEETGHEYMPDMAHSVAYEANVNDYYSDNHFSTPEEFKQFLDPRMPVKGSVARGYAGVAIAQGGGDPDAVMSMLKGGNTLNGISVPVNGSVPYYYADTEEERTRASKEILMNPFPITKSGLERGKALYEIFCGVCHGNGGAGNGGIYESGAYPAAPANLVDSALVNSSNGRYYHAIMYGKNVMGGYKDKLSFEERWQVIHYIRSLQAKEKQLVYNDSLNSLNRFAIPASQIVKKVVAKEVPSETTKVESHSDSNHNHKDGTKHSKSSH